MRRRFVCESVLYCAADRGALFHSESRARNEVRRGQERLHSIASLSMRFLLPACMYVKVDLAA